MRSLQTAVRLTLMLLFLAVVTGCPDPGPVTVTLKGGGKCSPPPPKVTARASNDGVGNLTITAKVTCGGSGVGSVILAGTLPVATGAINKDFPPTTETGDTTLVVDVTEVAVMPAKFKVKIVDEDGNELDTLDVAIN